MTRRDRLRLVDVDGVERWQGSRALVVVDRDFCPACGGKLDTEEVSEGALFFHGGYGATRRTTTLHCTCGWSLIVAVDEVRPLFRGQQRASPQ